MNAIVQNFGPPPVPLIPDTAPFTPEQRAWLNGFLAGIYGGAMGGGENMSMGGAPPTAAAPEPEEDFPWHDPALGLDERLALAEGKPQPRRLMAAMAQLDCGQCGYVCKTYAEAIASGAEPSLGLCVPGGKATQKALKALAAEAPAAAPKAKPKAAGPELVTIRMLSAERLTGEGSAKDVRHVTLDLAGSGLRYQPGDSLGLLCPNDPALVEACVAALGAAGDEAVPCPDGQARPVREAFASHLAIARPLDRTLDLLAGSARDKKEAKALRALAAGDDGAEPADADLLDLLRAFPSARPPLSDLAASLPGLKPRLYSIASSPLAAPGRVDLCVSVVHADRRGRKRGGVASSHLGFRCEAPLPAHMQESHFRLPEDPAVPVIMCGPGTGIAPFRAFLQHRAAQGIKGRTWLFFGDQRSATDFLFADEIAGWKKDGTLERLSLAWSRDSEQKFYVQDRMREVGRDLWTWLAEGAHVYVCGDGKRMAKDVERALVDIAAQYGARSTDEAIAFVADLKRKGRYQQDVY